MGSANSHQLTRKGKPMAILYVGIDLAKNVFAVHGVNESGKPELRGECLINSRRRHPQSSTNE